MKMEKLCMKKSICPIFPTWTENSGAFVQVEVYGRESFWLLEKDLRTNSLEDRPTPLIVELGHFCKFNFWKKRE